MEKVFFSYTHVNLLRILIFCCFCCYYFFALLIFELYLYKPQATSQYMHIQNIASFFPFIYFYLFVYSFAFFIMLNTVDFFPSRLPSLICKQRKKVAQVKVMYSYVGSTNVHITHQNRPPSKMPTFFFAVVIKDRLNINFNIWKTFFQCKFKVFYHLISIRTLNQIKSFKTKTNQNPTE